MSRINFLYTEANKQEKYADVVFQRMLDAALKNQDITLFTKVLSVDKARFSDHAKASAVNAEAADLIAQAYENSAKSLWAVTLLLEHGKPNTDTLLKLVQSAARYSDPELLTKIDAQFSKFTSSNPEVSIARFKGAMNGSELSTTQTKIVMSLLTELPGEKLSQVEPELIELVGLQTSEMKLALKALINRAPDYQAAQLISGMINQHGLTESTLIYVQSASANGLDLALLQVHYEELLLEHRIQVFSNGTIYNKLLDLVHKMISASNSLDIDQLVQCKTIFRRSLEISSLCLLPEPILLPGQ